MPESRHWDIFPSVRMWRSPSRHLGLSLDEDFCFEEFADRVAELVEKHVNINRLLELTKPVATAVVPISAGRHIYKRDFIFPIAVACDPAFNFCI